MWLIPIIFSLHMRRYEDYVDFTTDDYPMTSYGMRQEEQSRPVPLMRPRRGLLGSRPPPPQDRPLRSRPDMDTPYPRPRARPSTTSFRDDFGYSREYRFSPPPPSGRGAFSGMSQSRCKNDHFHIYPVCINIYMHFALFRYA